MDVASGDERGTTERVLALPGLLQQRQVWTGPELADRLGVTPRTVRRDVAAARSAVRCMPARVHVAARLARGARRLRLRLDRTWPYIHMLLNAFERLAALHRPAG